MPKIYTITVVQICCPVEGGACILEVRIIEVKL